MTGIKFSILNLWYLPHCKLIHVGFANDDPSRILKFLNHSGRVWWNIVVQNMRGTCRSDIFGTKIVFDCKWDSTKFSPFIVTS